MQNNENKIALVYVTGNADKFAEGEKFFTKYAPWIKLEQFSTDLEEIHRPDIAEVAQHKARAAYQLLGKPVLVDDMGFYLGKDRQFPGAFTKFLYQGIGMKGILSLLRPEDPIAICSTIAFCAGGTEKAFNGVCEGTSINPGRGKAQRGLPFYPYLVPNGAGGRTYAELQEQGEEEPYNYRMQALQKFLSWFMQSSIVPASLTERKKDIMLPEVDNSTIFYASGNAGKVGEVQLFFEKHMPSIKITQCKYDFEEIQDFDQKKIAVHKARQAWELLKHPVLVDDAGIYFEKYNQFPGVMSKFVYKGLGRDGIFKLMNPGDKAAFKLWLIYYYGNEQYECIEAQTPGTLVVPVDVPAPKGFDFDTFFAPDGAEGRTWAELRLTNEDEPYNYRPQALHKFVQWLKEQK